MNASLKMKNWVDYIKPKCCENFGMTKDCYTITLHCHKRRYEDDKEYQLLQDKLMIYIKDHQKVVIKFLAKMAVQDYLYNFDHIKQIMKDDPFDFEPFRQRHPIIGKEPISSFYTNTSKRMTIPNKMTEKEIDAAREFTLAILSTGIATNSDVETDDEQLHNYEIDYIHGCNQEDKLKKYQNRETLMTEHDQRDKHCISHPEDSKYYQNAEIDKGGYSTLSSDEIQQLDEQMMDDCLRSFHHEEDTEVEELRKLYTDDVFE